MIDVDTHVLSPSIATSANILKSNTILDNIKTNVVIALSDKYLPIGATLVIMDPYGRGCYVVHCQRVLE